MPDPSYNLPLLPESEDFITVLEFEALIEAANAPDGSEAVIKKQGNKYVLVSHTGKNLGTFDSKAAAEKREREIQFFKIDAGDTYHNRFAPDRDHNKGSKKFKPLVKKCTKCGTTSGQLDINHKDGNRKNNNRSNLNYMCRSCHRKMHAKRNGGRGSDDNRLVSFLAKGTIFEPDDVDKALAGHQNKDLMHVKFELCHTGVNKNKDGFITAEMQEGYTTAVNKPINWEHTNENIGVIYASEFKNDDGSATIISKAVVWKHKHPIRAREIAQRFADGDLFFSMETYFQKAQCSVCDDEFETSSDYCEHLNNRMQTDGTVRWLKGLNFVGAGCVKNPADVKARGLAVAAKTRNYTNLARFASAISLDANFADYARFLTAKNNEVAT